jgi:hypothetical protein
MMELADQSFPRPMQWTFLCLCLKRNQKLKKYICKKKLPLIKNSTKPSNCVHCNFHESLELAELHCDDACGTVFEDAQV